MFFLESVDEEKGNPESALYHCPLVAKYTAKDAGIVVNPSFESEVVRLHVEQEQEYEKEAVKWLLRQDMTTNINHASSSDERRPFRMEETLNKQRRKRSRKNCT